MSEHTHVYRLAGSRYLRVGTSNDPHLIVEECACGARIERFVPAKPERTQLGLYPGQDQGGCSV